MFVTDEEETNQGLRPLVVSPAKACTLLDCGISRIYTLMDAGELPSFLIGGRRKIAIEDIAKLIAQKRASPSPMRTMPWDNNGPAQRQYHPRREDAPDSDKRQQARAEAAEVKRGPGRPRKNERSSLTSGNDAA
jgi:hypothetical protein